MLYCLRIPHLWHLHLQNPFSDNWPNSWMIYRSCTNFEFIFRVDSSVNFLSALLTAGQLTEGLVDYELSMLFNRPILSIEYEFIAFLLSSFGPLTIWFIRNFLLRLVDLIIFSMKFFYSNFSVIGFNLWRKIIKPNVILFCFM